MARSSFGTLLQKQTDPSTKSTTCQTWVIWSRLSKAEAREFKEAMQNRLVPVTAIARALSEMNIEVRAEALRRHRRGDCSCKLRGYEIACGDQ